MHKFQPKIDEFSLTSLPIYIYGDNSESKPNVHATACFYSKGEKTYLITNWHVLSGYSWDRKEALKSEIPKKIGIRFFQTNLDSAQLASYGYDKIPFSDEQIIPLYSEDEKALWLEHSKYGSLADIAALEIEVPKGCKVFPISTSCNSNHQIYMHVAISYDVFILGFPKRDYTENSPIWKKRTIASEYSIEINAPIKNSTKKIKAFLVDTATHAGISGAPVILRKHGSYETLFCEQVMGTGTKFLGIYSGRYFPDGPNQNDKDVQLGIVFRESLIEEIISDGASGLSCIKDNSCN